MAVSALLGLGLEELKARLEEAVLRATGRRVLTLRVGLAGPQLRCVGPARRGVGWRGSHQSLRGAGPRAWAGKAAPGGVRVRRGGSRIPRSRSGCSGGEQVPGRLPAGRGRGRCHPPRSGTPRWGLRGSVGAARYHQTRLPPSWLHQEATVQAVDVRPEAGVADIKVIISDSAYGRFRKLFPG